jgi:hypothetical protein
MGAILALLLLLQAATATPLRPGVVVGRLQTKEGAPAAAIRISALPAPPPNIRPSDGQNYYSTTVPASTALTDAQGHYRLANLAPGRYFILATIFGYSTFYPATTSADGAIVVTVGADAPVEAVDFTVLMPPGGRISGRVDTPPGNAQERAVLSGLELGELLETPVGADGGFAFGHLPKGAYLLSLFPTPPGMPSHAFTVGETDARVDLVRPVLRTISGRVVVPVGPLPYMLLGFTTDTSYVTAPINADGTFHVQLQSSRHAIVTAGMPSAYSLGSVRLGAQDVTNGLVVGAGDIAGLVVTIAPPPRLPRLRGTIVGVPAARLAGARVELTGRVIGALEAPVQQNVFEFHALPPGTYRVRVPQVPDATPSYVVVDWTDTDLLLSR